MKQKVSYLSAGVRIAGNLYLPAIKNPQGLLILHGGGTSHKERFEIVQQTLIKKDIASFAIDFEGVGESQGLFENGSLLRRLRIAQDGLQEFKKHIHSHQLAVFGSSMGGFLAPLIAVSDKDVQKVILSAAAAYSPKAESKPLNTQFTNIITQPNSWKNSRSFDALEKFQGKALVLYGENDTTIPLPIQKHYESIAEKKGEWHVIPNGTHGIIVASNPEEKKVQTATLHYITAFLLS